MVDSMNDTDGTSLAEGSRHHRERMTPMIPCGCFHCQAVFSADGIRDWIDDGQTALCPRCGVDAVLPDVTGTATLRALHDERFGSSYQPSAAEWDSAAAVPSHASGA